MVTLLEACSSQKGSNAYQKISGIYQQARQAQDSAIYNKAMALYKECIYECSSDKYENDDSVKLLLPKSLIQLVNVYQSASMPHECISYLDSMRSEVDKKQAIHHNIVLTKTFKRDVYVLLSYAMSRTDAEKEAAQLMDTALTMPLNYPTPERKFRHYAYAAGVYYCVPTLQDKVLKYGRLALDEIKLCQEKSGAQWLVALMAKQYAGKGEIGKAISMCREGFELAEMCHDTLGMANSKKELADYLYQWDLYDDADKYASEAISMMESINNTNPMVMTVAYTIKAKILERKGKHQQALAYLQKAKKTSDGLPYNSGASDVDLWLGKIWVADSGQLKSLNHNSPQQKARFAEGIKLLTKVSQEATNKLKAQAFLELAKANINHHHEDMGGHFLDSMYVVLHTPTPPIYIEGAYDYALSYYLKTGNSEKIYRYSSAVNQQKIAEKKRGVMENVAKSLAHFEMDKQESEMERKMDEIENRKILEVIGIFSFIIILGGVIAFFVYKRKKMRQKHALTEQQLSNVQVALAKTSEQKDKAENELKTIEKKQINKVKDGVSLQQLLDMKGDKKFKDYFNKAYPYFIADLRRKVPHLTSKEELYCMLIALNCNNEELSRAFNIARSSVVVAKYRIRKKLNLEEGMSLEDFLARELNHQEENG